MMALHPVDAPRVLFVHWPQREPVARIWVEGKPIADNHMRGTSNKVTRNGRVHYYTPAAKTWRETIAYVVRNALVKERVRLTPPIHVVFILNRVTGDAANYAKICSDALQDATGINDKEFHPVTLDKQRDETRKPGVLIELYPLDQHPLHLIPTQGPTWDEGA